MRCYRYMKFQHAVSSLRETFYRVSSPSQFNDPFECRGRYVNFDVPLRKYVHDNYERLRFEAIRQTFSNTPEQQSRFTEDFLFKTYFNSASSSFDSGWLKAIDEVAFMLCFVKEKGLKLTSDVLFWSHYADAGQGIRITLDLPQSYPGSVYFMREVTYRDDIPVFDCVNMSEWLKGAEFQSYVEDLSVTKGKAWEYENEIRMVLPKRVPSCVLNGKQYLLERTDMNGMKNSYIRIEPEVVKRVDFGPRIDDHAVLKVMRELRETGMYPHVKYYKVDLDGGKYRYDYHYIGLNTGD